VAAARDKGDKIDLVAYMKSMFNDTGRLDLAKAPETALIRTYSKKMVSNLTREWMKINRNLQGIREMNPVAGRHGHRRSAPRRDRCQGKRSAWCDDRGAHPIPDSDPDTIDLPIPGNDDSIRSIELILQKLSDAVNEGRAALPAGSPARRAWRPNPKAAPAVVS